MIANDETDVRSNKEISDAPSRKGALLLVIPGVLGTRGSDVHLDEHFANNLTAYLENFESVTVACAETNVTETSVALSAVPGAERCRVVILPLPYREDRYFLRRSAVIKLLRAEIDKADYLLISPHAAFDWPTLAARLAIKMGRDFDMEADWHLENVTRNIWSDMPFGPNKLRKYLWLRFHTRTYLNLMRHSSVALLQGAAVFDAYRDVAPNPHKVLNIQISDNQRISPEMLESKLRRILSGEKLRIIYTGRANYIKGPFEWIEALDMLSKSGTTFSATWFGSGELMPQMKKMVSARSLDDCIEFPGNVERSQSMESVRNADIFLFCHLTEESPRCLVEAIASGASIVGYSSVYARDLVENGGGVFVERGDVQGLAESLKRLDADREMLADLVRAAVRSSQEYDRNNAIQERIGLIKKYVRPRSAPTA